MTDHDLERLISQLPASPTVLNKSNTRKMHKCIPVPTDHQIRWADVSSFGGYPAGIVITDQALIVKATRAEVKHNNEMEKEQRKQRGQKGKGNTQKVVFQIIPWEIYSPDDYEVIAFDAGKGKTRYKLKTGETELAQFESGALFQMFREHKKMAAEQREFSEAIIENSTFSAINSINVKGVMFNATYGAGQTKYGHGIYAEEAGAILDRLSGEKSTVVGRDNAKNGPDKIVNASPVQCKYYKTARATVNACFKMDPATGVRTFRYYDLSGNAMKIEVPSDQYPQAVEYMKTKISDGMVPSVSDPNRAYDIIRKGRLTYRQARNLARPGTIESLTFDTITGAVTCLSVLGISAVAAFAHVYWETRDIKKAAKSAFYTGAKVYGLTLAGSVFASQIARTGYAASLNPLATGIGKKLSPKLADRIANSYRALAGRKAVHWAAAQKSFAKFWGSTAITQGSMLFAFSVPDTYRLVSRKISGSQYWKNMSSLMASFVGSIAASASAGAVLGGTLGDDVDERIGSAVGLVAGMAGGAVCGTAVKAIGNILHEDDAVITTRLFNAVLANQFFNYMLTQEEENQVIALLDDDGKELRKLQQKLLTSDSQERDVIDYLEPKIDMVVKKRHRISASDESELENLVNDMVLEGGLAYDM